MNLKTSRIRICVLITLSIILAAPCHAAIFHTIEHGESLATIAQHYYGDSAKARLLEVYNQVSQPRQVRPGQRIAIPEVTVHRVKKGDTLAQFVLGVMYRDGEGVEQSFKEALKWFKKAANGGDAMAQLNIGLLYSNGQGVKQDTEKAAEWFKKAAEKGLAKAQLCLGLAYDFGEGLDQDHVLAARWYREAADQGDPQAQLNLGTLYTNGQGVQRETNQFQGRGLARAAGADEAVQTVGEVELGPIEKTANDSNTTDPMRSCIGTHREFLPKQSWRLRARTPRASRTAKVTERWAKPRNLAADHLGEKCR